MAQKKLGGGRSEKKKSWEKGELNWMDLDEEIKSREEGELLPYSSPLLTLRVLALALSRVGETKG